MSIKLALLCLACRPGPAAAQLTALPVPGAPLSAYERQLPADGHAVLPGNSEIWLTVEQELSSKQLRTGASFPLVVSRDVMLGQYVVIPRGTPAEGVVSWRTGKGAFGKSAKMEFDLVGVTLNGRTIPIGGHYRIEGEGNTGAAVGAVVAVGVFGAFVTGHSAVVNQGSEYRAFTKEAMAVNLPTSPKRTEMALREASYVPAPALPRALAAAPRLHPGDDAVEVPM